MRVPTVKLRNTITSEEIVINQVDWANGTFANINLNSNWTALSEEGGTHEGYLKDLDNRKVIEAVAEKNRLQTVQSPNMSTTERKELEASKTGTGPEGKTDEDKSAETAKDTGSKDAGSDKAAPVAPAAKVK